MARLNCVIRVCVLAGSSSFSALAFGALIEYELERVGESDYVYSYVVQAGATERVALFDILFDPFLYDENSLRIVSSSSIAESWSESIFGSGLLVPAAYDVAAIGPGLPVGAVAEGFGVRFRWLGSGTPGSQPFEVYDASTFDLIQTGQTAVRSVSVPEPQPLFFLILLGVAVLMARGTFNLASSMKIGDAVEHS